MMEYNNRTPLPNRQFTSWRNVLTDTLARFGKELHGVKAVGKSDDSGSAG